MGSHALPTGILGKRLFSPTPRSPSAQQRSSNGIVHAVSDSFKCLKGANPAGTFFFPSYLYCAGNGRHFPALAAVTPLECERDKFSPGSMSDGTNPASRCCSQGWLSVGGMGPASPQDWCQDMGWTSASSKWYPPSHRACTPCFERLALVVTSLEGGKWMGLWLCKHEKGVTPVPPHSAPIKPYGPEEKSGFSLVRAL